MIPKQEIKKRLKRIRKGMDEVKIDLMLISKPKNLFYASGLKSGRMLLTQDSCTVFTSELNYKTTNAPGFFDIKIYEKNNKNTVI